MQTGLDAELIEHAIAAGASKIGFADMSGVASDVREGLPTGISIAVALTPAIVEGIMDGPTVEYDAEYSRVNDLLDEIAESCAAFLREKGHKTHYIPHTGVKIDRATLSTVLPHKTVAVLAGMGWIGKCALLVTEEFGSAVRLTTLLTDAPLQPAAPTEESRCGDCVICTSLCPASAPTGENWQPNTSRSDIYDAFACFQKAYSLSQALEIEHIICGKCIANCPWTQRYLDRMAG